jgi:hypothetical protein
LALALWTTACGTSCDREGDDEDILFKGGSVNASGTFYESSDWDGPLLHFPTGRRYKLVHFLRSLPQLVQTYVAFEERPDNLSESAGNQAVIESVDDTVIQVRNDTCAEFFLRVVATASGEPLDGGPLGGGQADAAAGD